MTTTERDHAAPKVTVLSTTPIKGFGLHHPTMVSLDTNGAIGDRDFFLIDDEQRLLSITRTGVFASWTANFDRETDALTLSHAEGDSRSAEVVLGEAVVGNFEEDRHVPGRLVGGQWGQWLSELADRPVTLVRADQPGGAFDVHPVTVLSEASVADLGEEASDAEIDPRRFRMLIGISGVDAYEEDSWQSRKVRVGTALLRLQGPVPRCNATTRNPASGERDLKTLALITARRGMMPNDWGDGLNLGVYADVLEPGAVSVGDELIFSDDV